VQQLMFHKRSDYCIVLWVPACIIMHLTTHIMV